MDEEFEKNGLGIAALVCGIVSVSLCGAAIPIGILFPFWGCSIAVVGIIPGIFAIVAGTRSRKYSYPAGKAVAGFILGIIATSIDAVIFTCCFCLYLFL